VFAETDSVGGYGIRPVNSQAGKSRFKVMFERIQSRRSVISVSGLFQAIGTT